MNDQTPDPSSLTRQGMDYGETADVHEVHAAIQREKREPRVGLEPLSIWLIAVYGLAIFTGGAYLGRYSGNFSGDGLDPLGGPPPAKKGSAAGPGGPIQELTPRDRGKKIFVRRVTKRTVWAFPVNIRRWQARNSPRAVRNDQP